MVSNYNILKLIESRDDIIKYDNAYVWLLMIGDRYLPGIIASICSVIEYQKLHINIVVMITADVSEESIIALNKISDYIVVIDYLEHPTVKLKTDNQDKLYGSWINKSFTKWNCLRLPFKKVLFLDADVIAMDNIDELFNMNTPAGPFNFSYCYPLGNILNPYITKYNKGLDGYPKHESLITKSMIRKAYLNDGYLATASPMLLKPCIKDFNKLWNMVLSKPKFGVTTNFSGFDEQAIMYYYSLYKNGPKLDWTNIHHRYNSISWKTNQLKKELPKIIHYTYDIKPWEMEIDLYEDLLRWYNILINGICKYKIHLKCLNMKFVYKKVEYTSIKSLKELIN